VRGTHKFESTAERQQAENAQWKLPRNRLRPRPQWNAQPGFRVDHLRSLAIPHISSKRELLSLIGQVYDPVSSQTTPTTGALTRSQAKLLPED